MHTRTPILLIVLLGIYTSGISAEEYMKRGASVQDYEQALQRSLGKKRGLTTGRERVNARPSAPTQRQTSAAAAAAVASTGAAAATHQRLATGGDVYKPPASDEEGSGGVSIYFGYNSANLTPNARIELKKLGQALGSEQFADVYWLIEGHTDSSGSADYNQRLSEQRARSAQLYLIEECGVVPDKLIAVGKGESDPYDRSNPRANINRRVRLKPVGGG